MSEAVSVSFAHAYGAFLGVLCGDAAGATLEFVPGAIQVADVERAMTMPGGGILRIGKGQITDDSELAISLARGLINHAPNAGFPVNSVAKQYLNWYKSNPFDIGHTCRTAFNVNADIDEAEIGVNMIQQSKRYNMMSEANGALMRVIPIPIWSASESDEMIAALASNDATLSHPNQVCQDCNAIYSILVAHLICHPGDSQGALARADAFVKKHVESVVRKWFLDESLDISSLICTRHIGHVRYGFVLAVHFLRQNESYERAIHQTLLKGGDTDTNAAIVGGMIGALHGMDGIPKSMRDAVLAFDCSTGVTKNLRPAEYKSEQIFDFTKRLIGLIKDE